MGAPDPSINGTFPDDESPKSPLCRRRQPFREQPWTLLSSTLYVDDYGNTNFPKHMLLLAAFSVDDKCPSLSTISFSSSPEALTGKSYNVVVPHDGVMRCTSAAVSAVHIEHRRFRNLSRGRRYEELQSGEAWLLSQPLECTGVRGVCSVPRPARKDIVARTDHEIEIDWRRTSASFNWNLHWVDRWLGIVAYDSYHVPGPRPHLTGILSFHILCFGGLVFNKTIGRRKAT
nr:F-box protein At3g26010-like [Ipomoea batatas]